MSSHANNTVSEILIATELNSLLNIVAFFDWDTFKKFETLDYNDDEDMLRNMLLKHLKAL